MAANTTGQQAQPTIELVIQPSPNFAMDKENVYITAENKGKGKKPNVPQVRINDPQGRGGQLVIVGVNSTPDKDLKYHVHPNKLLGEFCRSNVGVYQFKPGQTTVEIDKLQIKKINQKNINECIDNLSRLKIDPYKVGYGFSRDNIKLNELRLAFQAFLRDKQNPQDIKKMVFTAPIVSNIIYDTDGAKILIEFINPYTDFWNGGSKMSIITPGIRKLMESGNNSRKELLVNFTDGKWKANAIIERSYEDSLIIVIPTYYNDKINKEINVGIQLLIQDNQVTIFSNIHTFIYKPVFVATKRPLAYDEYYECEPPDHKNAIEISKTTRKNLSKRTKTIWSISKAETIAPDKKIDLKLDDEKSDLVGNNYLINYSNEESLHYLQPVLNIEDQKGLKYEQNKLLERLVSSNINTRKRITCPSENRNDETTNEEASNFSSYSIEKNSTPFYNFDEIIDLIDDANEI